MQGWQHRNWNGRMVLKGNWLGWFFATTNEILLIFPFENDTIKLGEGGKGYLRWVKWVMDELE